MIKFFLSIGVILSLYQVPSYVIADNSSTVKFKIKNLGVTVTGSLKGLKGKSVFDPNNLAASSIESTVDVNTINTGIDMRDDHLKEEEYFDAKNYPQLKFVSKKIVATGRAGGYTITGLLTIKSTTREVSFPFTATPEGNGFRLKGEFKLNRRDYGVGGSSFTLSDNLSVILDVLAARS